MLGWRFHVSQLDFDSIHHAGIQYQAADVQSIVQKTGTDTVFNKCDLSVAMIETDTTDSTKVRF